MDKLKALYDSYIQQGILSSQTTFEQFSSADTATQENLYKQGVDNKILSSQTDINTFQSAWGEVKKKDESVSIVQEDVTESITPEVQEEVISSDASYQRDDSITDNDYLVGLSNGSIKTNEGSVATITEVIAAAKEQGYPQEEIDSLMVASSSDPTDSISVSNVPIQEDKPNWKKQIDELGESASVWNDPSAEGVSIEEIREYYLSTQQPESVPTDSTLTEQEDIVSSDTTIATDSPTDIVDETVVEKTPIPTELDQQIYQGIYGRAIEQGDASVPTIEEWLTNEGISGASTEDANKEALEMAITAAKTLEKSYDETFIGDLVRTLSIGNNKELKLVQLGKQKEKVYSDADLTEEERAEKIKKLNTTELNLKEGKRDNVWASEPMMDITGYAEGETSEFATGILSTVVDFFATPNVGIAGAITKVLPKLPILGVAKYATDALVKRGFKPSVASKMIKEQLPKVVETLDKAGSKFALFETAKDFQQQVDQYGGINEVDFTQSPEAFAKGYGLGAGLGLIGVLGRQIPKLGTALKTEGATAVKQKGVTQALVDRGLSDSRIIGTVGETIGLGGEVATFGLINAMTPTLENPEGELTTESFTDGMSEALKYIIGFRAVGLASRIAKGQTLFNKQYSEFNKAEKEQAFSLMSEINNKIKSGELTEQSAKEYLRNKITVKLTPEKIQEKIKSGEITKANAAEYFSKQEVGSYMPITLIEKVFQEISGMKSNLSRKDVFNKVFEIEAQAKTDGTYRINTYSKDGLLLTTANVKGPAEVSGFINKFKKVRANEIEKSANGEGNYPLSNRVNYSINPQPLLEAPITEEDAAQKLIEEGVQNATPEEVKQKQQELLKEQANAIQEPSTETVDVQEQTGDSQTVGEGDTEVSELTTETTQEVQESDVSPEVQAEVAAMEADERIDLSELNALYPKAPEFRLKSADETQVDAVESAKVTDVINEIESPNKEVQLAFQSSSPISVDGLNKRTDTPLKSTTLKVVDGIPTIFTITDQLTTGNTVNPETGNTIDNLKGAVGFNGTKGHENFAWANLGVNEGNAIISKATKVFEDNKSIFEKWWKENPEYNGLVPMNVVKMGEGAMISNEATFRVLADNISTLPSKNRKAALPILKREIKSEIKKLSSIKNPTSGNKKVLGLYRKIQSEISNTKATSIEQVLSSEVINKLALPARALLINKIAYGSVGEPGLKIKTPGTPSKLVTKALLEGQPKESRRKVNLGVITDVITDPELRNVPIGNIVSLVGVDVLNPQVLETTHPNYKYGVKGKSIGVLDNPVPMEKAYPKTYEKSFKVLIDKESKGKKASGPSIIAQQSGVGIGIPSLDYVGAMTSSKSENVNKLVSFLNESFPSVTLSVDSKEFNDIMNTEGVKKYLKGDEVVYGVTVNGDVYVNPEVHNSESALFNTAIHEMGHVWTDYLQTTKKGREMYAKGIELVKETDTYREQLEIFNGDEAKAANEAMAILIGNKGETITDGAIKSNFKEWLLGLWNYIKKQFKNFKDLTSKEIQDLNLDQFLGTALRDILGGKPIKLTPKQREAMKADAAFRKMSPSNKKIVRSAVEKLRGLGYSEVAIGKLLKQKGFESNLISEVLANNKKASPKAKVTEDLVPGSKKVENAIDDIIKRTQERADKKNNNKGPKNITPKVSQEVLLKNAIEYLKSTPLYERASDVVREELVRGVRKKLSLKEKSAPSVGKVLGVIKDVKKITIREKDLLKLRMQEAVKAAKGAVDFSKKFKADIANDLFALVDKGQLTQRQAVVLAKRLAEMDVESQKSIDRFTDYVEKVFNDSTGKYKQSVIKDIVKFVNIKSKKALTDSNKVRGKGLDAQGQAFFQASKRVLSRILEDDLNPEAVEKEFFPNIEEVLYKQGELTTKEQAQLDSYIAFEIFKGIEDMSVQEVEQLFKDIRNESSESISRLKEKLAIEKAELIKLRDVADSDIGKGFPELYEDGKLLDVGVAQNKKDVLLQIMEGELYTATKEYVKKFNPTEPGAMLNAISNNLKLLGTLTNGLDKQGDFFTKNVYKNLNNMESNYIKGLQSTRTTLDDIASSIKGVKNYKDIVKKLDNTSEESLKGKLFGVHKVTGITTGKGKDFFKNFYSGDQLLRIYALSKNPIQRDKLRRQGFTDTKIEEIKEKLGFEVVEFADKVVDYLSTDYFEQTNKVYSDVNNVNLNYVENYFPTRTVTKDVSVLDIQNGNFDSVFNAQVADALKSRVDLGSDINIKDTDFTTALEDHFNSVERYKAYAKGVKNLNLEFNFNSVRTLLEVSGMKSVIRNAVNFAVNPNGGQKAIQPSFISKLMTKYTGFSLAFKLMQIPKQATSFVLAFEDYNYRGEGKKKIPGLDLLMFMVDQAKTIATLPKEIKEAYNTSPMFKERIKKGVEGDVFGLETGSVTFKPISRQSGLLGKAKRTFKTAAGLPTVIGDIAGVMGYWASYKRDIANGMSKEKALKKFEDYNTTQQSRRPADKIPLQMSSNAYVRTFTMFGSTLFLQMNKVMQAFTNISRATSRGKIPKAKDTRALILNLGLANVLFQLTANIFKYLKGNDEDAEEVITTMKDAMSGLNLIYQVPFFGAAVEVLMNKYRGTNRPVDIAVNPLSPLINKGMKLAKNDKPVEAVVRTAAEIIMGTQFDPFIGLYEGVSSGFGDKESYDVIGVSKSYRPSEKKKSKPMTKTQLKEVSPELYQIINELNDLGDIDLGLEDL